MGSPAELEPVGWAARPELALRGAAGRLGGHRPAGALLLRRVLGHRQLHLSPWVRQPAPWAARQQADAHESDAGRHELFWMRGRVCAAALNSEDQSEPVEL